MYSAVKTGNRAKRKSRSVVDIKQIKWPKGYISTYANSRRPIDSLSDCTNIELVQDGIPRPRPSLVRYGVQPTLTVCGRGHFTEDGVRKEIFMMNDSGVGKVYVRQDGSAFNLVGGTYDASVWTQFTQSNRKVYIWNGVDNLSYYDLQTDAIVTYTNLSAPSAPTPTKTGLSGTTFTYYYKVAANNAVGTSASSVAGTVTVGKVRDLWNSTTDYVTVTWSSVVGATSYNVYVGDSAGNEYLLYTTTGLSYLDDGTLVPDVFTPAPLGNSTDGPILKHMYNDSRNSQLYGLDNDNNLYYSAPGTGDFSPYNGGGYVPIDEYGDTVLNYVDGFRDGKGNPVVTVSGRGAAGKGKMWHATQESATYGDQVITYYNVYEANGQSAPYGARAVIKARDSLWYPTGDAFKSTGTSQNIVNILTTSSISQVIEPDVDAISLASLDKAVGVEYKDKLFWALPVGSTENNQIWYMDLARNNLWVLRWTVSAMDLWLYEDSDGATHFCALVDNKILEFSRNVDTEDDGTAFRTRVGFSSLVFDETGLVMANIRKQYYKLLEPKGSINFGVYGIDKDGVVAVLASEPYQQSVTFTGYDVWLYDEYEYDDDVGTISTFGKSIDSKPIKTNAKLINQLDWEVVTEGIGADYLLSSVKTEGHANNNRKLGD